jgi:hypothetical protein
MPVYFIEERIPMDSLYMAGLAADLCFDYGIFCTPSIGQDDEGNWWVTQDHYAMWGDPVNGIIQFVDTDEYISSKEVAPALPDSGTAAMMTQSLLSGLGLLPTGSYTTGATLNIQTAYDLDAGSIMPDSSFDLSMNMEYYRVVDGYPVFGPGGYMTVTWGEGDDPQHFTLGGWHDLTLAGTEPVISVTEAMDLVATIGQEATIGGVPPPCDSIYYDTYEYAFYNTNGEYETDILEPIYHFSCICFSDYDTLETDIYVPALQSQPHGMIIEPDHGDTVTLGDPIQFVGLAMNGAGPYTFTWESLDMDSILQVTPGVVDQDTLITDGLTEICEGHDGCQYHSVKLTVEDSNGKKASHTVGIMILPASSVDEGIDPKVPSAFSLAQNLPNPFQSVTEIRYALPKACDVKLRVYNMLGQQVRTLVNEHQQPGYKSVWWDGRNDQGAVVSSGIYFCKFDAGTYEAITKMVLLK